MALKVLVTMEFKLSLKEKFLVLKDNINIWGRIATGVDGSGINTLHVIQTYIKVLIVQ